MKRIMLLLIVLCVSTLYGMESEQGHYVGMEELPSDVQVMIIQALNDTYDEKLSSEKNLINTVNAIKAISRTNKQLNAIVNGMYGNLAAFTELVHILADKFYKPTISYGVMDVPKSTKRVAEKFGTPVAKQYIELNDELLKMTAQVGSMNPNRTEVINKLKELINTGADVNYLPAYSENVKVGKVVMQVSPTPMTNAIHGGNFDTVKLLLDSGAKLESDEYYDTFGFWPDKWRYSDSFKQKMKQLIYEERAKRQQ